MEAAGCSYQFRIALLGDAAVGKTSLLRRYVAGARGAAEPEPEPTVGVEFYSRALQLPAGLRVKLQLWDTAGHERFRCGEKGEAQCRAAGVEASPAGAHCRGSKPGSGVPTLSTPPYSPYKVHGVAHPPHPKPWRKCQPKGNLHRPSRD